MPNNTKCRTGRIIDN